jgi:predicted porin
MKSLSRVAALGALLAPALALAQSNVALYGIIDTYAGHTHAGGKAAVTTIDSGAYQASRLGFRGTEDLGDGLRVNFLLENGFLSDTGAQADGARLFNRQAWVGLAGRYGELRAGRQNAPAFLMLGRLDAFGGATYASFLNNVTAYTPRYDNVIGYQSPSLGGFKAQAYLSLGEQAARRSALNTWLAAAEYENGPLYFGVNTARQNSANGSVSVRSSFAGGNVDYGSGRVYVGFYSGNNLGANAAANVAGKQYRAASISADYRLGAATLGAGCGWADDRSATGNDARQWSLLAAYDLSKRTRFYSTYAHLMNSNGAAFALGAAGPITKDVPPAGRNVDGFQVGVRHAF